MTIWHTVPSPTSPIASGYIPAMLDPRHSRHAALWALVAPATASADLAHGQDHVLRVYTWAVRLAPEAQADPDLCGAAALVHDLVAVPKESADRPLGGERSAAAAAGPLEAAGYDPAEVAAIREAVRTSSWSRGLDPTGPVGVALQDADRLDVIGAVGLARTFATAQAMAARSGVGRLWHPTDPLGQSGREHDDRRYAVDHFFRKMLRIADGMRLPSAQAEALRRHAFLLVYLEELGAELGVRPGVPRD